MCQVLRISSHKYSTEAQHMKTESFPLQLSLTTHFLFAYIEVFRVFFFFIYLIIEKFVGSFVSLFCGY